MDTLTKAIEHYNYGISHDIFSEPVTSYAKLAVEALNKQIPKTPLLIDGRFSCPSCRSNTRALGYYCDECGQKIDWDCEE